ncbi:MAG: primase-helicase family protein [Pseudomonadota bacterium]
MARLAGEFVKTAASVKIVGLPGLEAKGDVSDWIASGGTKEALLDLCKKTLNFEASEDPVDELNKIHAVVGIGDKVCILHELINEKNKLELKFMTEYSFNLKYRNREIPNPLAGGKGQSKTISLSTAWLKSHKRREYDKVVFAPNGACNRFYNLYQGLAYKPIKGDWSLFRSHIFENICRRNVFHYDWLMAWMARIVQDPGGERPGTVVVLKGLKGTGKDVFVQAFGKIFGDHFLEVSSQDQVVGKHNNHLKSIILLFANEAWFAGDKAVEGNFKRLITSPSMVIEPKGVDAFLIDNHLNCIVASDGEWVVPVGDNERRFFILDVSEEHLQDLEYFGAIDEQMYHKGGISAFLYDLMQVDYKKHVLRQAPKTEALVYQASLNFNSFQKFWYNILQDGPEWPWNLEGRIEIKKLHSQYVDFCKELNLRYPIDAAIFGKYISKYNKISDDMTVKEQQMVNGDRIFFYKFPDKDVCRKKFCRVINNEIDFEDGVVFDIDSI